MPSPAGAFNMTNNTVWDEFSDYWGPATSTPDLSTLEIPVAYQVALESGAPGITQKIQEVQKPGESWTDAAIRAFTGLAMGVQQLQFMQINVDRAKKGLPPVDAAQYSGAYVNVGLNPETQRLIIYAGIGLVALFALSKIGKK
jgi:hypothetical protein